MVLVFPRQLLDTLGDFQGIQLDASRYIGSILDGGQTRFMPRSQAEENPDFKQVQQWTELDPNCSVGEFRLQLHGWEQHRRFVVIRERIRDEKHSVGRKKLLDIPGYTFRTFVTNGSQVPQEVWRDYNQRADVENRIADTGP